MVNTKKQEKIKEILKHKTVGIAGLGGLGSNIATSLARTGIGKLVLIDFDKIEKSNLNRQNYFLDQIGEYKTQALTENIKKINPETEIKTYNVKLKKGNMSKYFKDVDIVIEALDSAETKTDFIEEIASQKKDTPLVAASGVAGFGRSDSIKTKKMGNLYMVYDEDAPSSDNDILTAPRVNLIANWQANIVLEILLGEQ